VKLLKTPINQGFMPEDIDFGNSSIAFF